MNLLFLLSSLCHLFLIVVSNPIVRIYIYLRTFNGLAMGRRFMSPYVVFVVKSVLVSICDETKVIYEMFWLMIYVDKSLAFISAAEKTWFEWCDIHTHRLRTKCWYRNDKKACIPSFSCRQSYHSYTRKKVHLPRIDNEEKPKNEHVLWCSENGND